MIVPERYEGKYRKFVPWNEGPTFARDILLKGKYSLDPTNADIVSRTADMIWRYDCWAAYCLKVAAARSFESLIYCDKTPENPNWTMIIQAAYAYSKAAKNANLLPKHHQSAIRCRMLSHRLFSDALLSCRGEKSKTGIRRNIEIETKDILKFFERFDYEQLGFYT